MDDNKIYDEYELPKNRKKKIMNDLSAIDEMDDDYVLISDVAKKSSEDTKNKSNDEGDVSPWLTRLSVMSNSTIRANKSVKNLFKDKKDKKKKKKKDNEPTDFNKEFESEIALLDNLLIDQTRFVDSLQQTYDRINTMKTNARGTGKFTTDLITGINTGRQLSSQLVDKLISTKKTIIELGMKERKELNANELGEDMNNFASRYLKDLIAAKPELSSSYGDFGVENMDDFDDVSRILDSNVDDSRGDDVSAYLKYEKRNVSIIVLMNPNNMDDYEFIAEAEDGEILTDYPLPEHTSLSLNRSTMIATDTYGKKYHTEFKEE